MTHSEMEEMYELYLMGVLESEPASEISDHLRRNCEHCSSRVNQASELLAAIASTADLKQPPAYLRQRVISMVAQPAEEKKAAQPRWWSYAFALSSAAAILLLIWGVSEQTHLNLMRDQLQEVSRQRNELRAALVILGQTDMRTVKFGKAEAEPHGQVFVSRNGGVVFLGRRLPQLADGRTFEFWLVPAKGNPQAAGLFTTNAEGLSVNVLSQSINPGEFAAIAVSIEPGGGSPQPSSKPILIVPLA